LLPSPRRGRGAGGEGLSLTLMSAEGSRYNRGGYIEPKASTPNGLAAR
jgi:hypothetical protein